MSNLPRPGSQDDGPVRSARRVRITVVMAVIAIAGLMLASAPPALAYAYDWYWWSDNWESSRDEGGWDGLVLVGYARNGQDYWVNAGFGAYGEHFYAYNTTERPADATLAAAEFGEFEDWVDVTVQPGECITWGWGTQPSEFSHCHDLGDRDILEDREVVINVCAQDLDGWVCHGEAGES